VSETRRPREALLPSFLALALCGVAVWWVWRVEARTAKARVAAEDRGYEVARQVRAAAIAYRERTGEHGWLADLARAGLLEGLDLRPPPDPAWVDAGGYRVEILLPQRGAAKAGLVAIAPADAGGAVDRALARRHFVVVARPIGPEPRGFRTWYLDEGEHTWVSEGASDEIGRISNPLPLLHLGLSDGDDTSGLSWTRLDRIDPDAQ
jgi:hypothetical protein